LPPSEDAKLKSLRRPDGRPAEVRAIVSKGQYLRFILTNVNLQRIAVGDPEIAAAETISDREVIILGKNPGTTSVILWFRDRSSETLLLSVQRDLTLLGKALQDIHPSISVEGAPDRDALILRGHVPDVTYSHAAEAAARSYLSSTVTAVRSAGPLVREPGKAAPLGRTQETFSKEPAANGPENQETELRADAKLPRSDVAVINLIRLDKLPPLPEETITAAIKSVGGENVTVRRVLKGRIVNDAEDILVLEGKVANQVVLTRVLNVAARVFGKAKAEITLLADEAGGIPARGGATAGSASSTPAAGVITGSFGAGSSLNVFGTSGRGLSNLLSRNVGRARALSLADGKILSFIEVVDLPQIRVSVKLYEINRNRLQAYSADVIALLSDFKQPKLLPAIGAVEAQGTEAARVGSFSNIDVQQVLRLLNGGLSGQTQLVAGNFALDMLLSLLENKGIARRLSAPSLSVLNGEIAQFQVGGEVPVSTSFTPASGSGVNEGVFSTVTFVPFGVQLEARPLVDEHDTMTIDLVPQVTTPDPALTTAIKNTTGTDQPTTAFQTRSLRTTAQLQDGESLLVGGLTTRTTDRSDGATPIISKIPLLGKLFETYSDSRTGFELVLLVNPVIVRVPSRDFTLWEFPPPLEQTGP
jgi:Flp pilus assembly secretin CpaC